MGPPGPVLGPQPGLPACTGHCLALAGLGWWSARPVVCPWVSGLAGLLELGSDWCREVDPGLALSAPPLTHFAPGPCLHL